MKLTKKQLAPKGKKIMDKAHEIREKHPHKKWTTCVAEAAKSLKK
jgi:hypothetical protein